MSVQSSLGIEIRSGRGLLWARVALLRYHRLNSIISLLLVDHLGVSVVIGLRISSTTFGNYKFLSQLLNFLHVLVSIRKRLPDLTFKLSYSFFLYDNSSLQIVVVVRWANNLLLEIFCQLGHLFYLNLQLLIYIVLLLYFLVILMLLILYRKLKLIVFCLHLVQLLSYQVHLLSRLVHFVDQLLVSILGLI